MIIKKISLKDQVIIGKQAIKDKNYELGLRCLDKVFVLYPNHTETKLQIRKLLKKTRVVSVTGEDIFVEPMK